MPNEFRASQIQTENHWGRRTTATPRVQVQGRPSGAHVGFLLAAWHCGLNLDLDVRCLNLSGSRGQRYGRHWADESPPGLEAVRYGIPSSSMDS